MPDEDATRRASRAQSILSDPLIEEAFAKLEKRWTETFKATDPIDRDARERCYFQLRALASFRKVLTEFVTTGKLLAATEEAEQRTSGGASRAEPV